MNHPNREEMMEYLYGELPEGRREPMENHLQACPTCRQAIETWRGSMRAMDAWKLPPMVVRTPAAQRAAGSILPWLRWAAAAALVMGVGFVAGRGTGLSSGQINELVRREVATQVLVATDRQRSALADELRTAAGRPVGDETRRLLADFAEQLEERRQADAEVFYTALEQLDARRSAEVARLRQDLGTVAVVADARLSDTQEQLLQLASERPELQNNPQP